MASKKKGTKAAKPAAGTVTHHVTVPAGTKAIIIHVTIGKPGKVLKMAKSGIDDDPLGGDG